MNTKVEYWPGTGIIKSTENAFNWREVRFDVSDDLSRYMGRVVRGIENAKQGKQFKKGEVVLDTPQSKPIQMMLKSLSGKQK